MNGGQGIPSWGVVLLAALVIGVIGAYALIYPNTSGGTLALGALLPLAGLIGGLFFHTVASSFLGTQLAQQRAAYLHLAAVASGTPNASNGRETGASSASTSGSATSTPMTIEEGGHAAGPGE